MRLTEENKKKITDRIRTSAGQLFRAEGFEAVNIDKVMAAAGLTRGAFYAHFPSKSALLAEVLRHEHPVLRMLAARQGDAAALRAQMEEIFSAYLDPAHQAEIFRGCSLAALSESATRGPLPVREGLTAAFEAICAEMARGQGHPPCAYAAPLILAAGAVRQAQATPDAAAREALLRAAHAGVLRLLPESA
ncbi:transcriptional regulator, TetR family [Pseudooceanicola antarcticus]|uniref:TetR/AcrR family transcriptional regulator n=1 Tax=Pseudooceanicola antarcticus TaxID=1247613 RepID=A0A285J4R2_9RHOB|nr:TetR/AcrR family transcriptional regulator [Pseudooceanicola antarcticus]SNY54081.1 transcriptional regulator, TetR family [Pseudooceanicola antarcticus]